jgi:hypothetical protein
MIAGAMRGGLCEVIDTSGKSKAVAQGADVAPLSAVIARESGQSSTLRPLDSITTASEY